MHIIASTYMSSFTLYIFSPHAHVRNIAAHHSFTIHPQLSSLDSTSLPVWAHNFGKNGLKHKWRELDEVETQSEQFLSICFWNFKSWNQRNRFENTCCKWRRVMVCHILCDKISMSKIPWSWCMFLLLDLFIYT